MSELGPWAPTCYHLPIEGGLRLEMRNVGKARGGKPQFRPARLIGVGILVLGGSAALISAPRVEAFAKKGMSEELSPLLAGSNRRPVAGIVLNDPPEVWQDLVAGGPIPPGNLLHPNERLVRSDDWTQAGIAVYRADGSTALLDLTRTLVLELPRQQRFVYSDDGGTLVAHDENKVATYAGNVLLGDELIRDIRHVRISSNGSVLGVVTGSKLVILDRNAVQARVAARVDDLRLSPSGAWEAHFRDRSVDLVLAGNPVASFRTHAGLPRDGAVGGESRVALVDPQ
jgi:hypothetical protein